MIHPWPSPRGFFTKFVYAFNNEKTLLLHLYFATTNCHYWSINLSFPFPVLADLLSQPPGFTTMVSFDDSKLEEEVKKEKEDDEEKEKKGWINCRFF